MVLNRMPRDLNSLVTDCGANIARFIENGLSKDREWIGFEIVNIINQTRVYRVLCVLVCYLHGHCCKNTGLIYEKYFSSLQNDVENTYFEIGPAK